MTTTMKAKKGAIGNAHETGTDIKAAGGISQVGIGLILSLAALVGLWGLASFFSGIVSSGGLLDLARDWLTAVAM
jgi:hypothetical protein